MTFTQGEFISLFISSIALFGLLTAFAFAFAKKIRKRKQQYLLEMAELKHTYEQELLKSQLEIQEETLKHISEEIHDNIGQVLSLAKLHLNVLPAPPAKENETSVLKVKELVSKAIADLRQLSKSLHPDRLNELGLEENIRQELDNLQKTGLYITHLHTTGNVVRLEGAKQIILFRIVQEALSNIFKHAQATEVVARLSFVPGKFTLEVQDNGVGFDNAEVSLISSGIGLRNMKNRALLINAQLSISRCLPTGSLLKVEMPV